MKRALILFAAILIAVAAFAQHEEKPQAGSVAHGAEKETHETAHPTEPHGEHHQAERTYFGIPGWILKLVNMFLFIGLLVWLLRKPIKSAFQARGERIRADLAEARERREKSDRMAAEIQGRLDKIEDEVAMILRRAEEEGERQKQELIAAANEEAEKIVRAARNEVDARVKLARKELTDYAGELAAQRAHQILRDTMTETDQKKIFDESLEAVARERS